MWDREHLVNNIRLAMLHEMMGVGPMRYCILTNAMEDFESKLLLLMYYLPTKNMCFFPPQYSLMGPFDCSLWIEIGKAISI